MQCPLCGAENDFKAHGCEVCDTDLPRFSSEKKKGKGQVILDTVNGAGRGVSFFKLALWVCAIVAVAGPWVLMRDLLTVPEVVKYSRMDYADLKASYLENAATWDTQKSQVLQAIQTKRSVNNMSPSHLFLREVPMEVALSFLLKDLHFIEAADDIAFYPKSDPMATSDVTTTLILSKYQSSFWPLSILLSLEIHFREMPSGQVVAEFTALKRGSRTVPVELAWTYFATELNVLSRLEQMAGGVQELRFIQNDDTALLQWTEK